MTARAQITIDPETRRRAKAKAAELGISFAEFVRRAMNRALGEPQPKPDISVLFDLVDEGPVTDIARNKDEMIAEAVWQEHLRKTRHKPSKRRPDKR